MKFIESSGQPASIYKPKKMDGPHVEPGKTETITRPPKAKYISSLDNGIPVIKSNSKMENQ